MTESYVDPTRFQFNEFKALDRDSPIQMLNLVRLRDRALYPLGHDHYDADLTGAEAYRLYGRDSGPVFMRVGGRILWRGQFHTTLIGPPGEVWDHAFIAEYPTAHAFFAMVTDRGYAKAVVHRQAAVVTSRLIRCGQDDVGETFG